MAGSLPRSADARLTGDRSQRVFDALLRTLAEPGTIRSLPDALPTSVPTVAWLPLALADVDVLVVITDGEGRADTAVATAVTRMVVEATRATASTVPGAWLVAVLPDPAGRPAVLPTGIATGTALAPEDGARVALPVASLTPGPRPATPADGPISTLTMAGPGVPTSRTVSVAGLDPTVAAALGTATGAAPTGFDTWLFTPGGSVMALSRTTTITVGPDAPERREEI
ncbi:MAG: phosphonate C-P lyase system protein PhnH [Actinomycetota bacterium]